MNNTTENRLSELEKDLNELTKIGEVERVEEVRRVLTQMADTTTKRVVIGTYPACNSEA